MYLSELILDFVYGLTPYLTRVAACLLQSPTSMFDSTHLFGHTQRQWTASTLLGYLPLFGDEGPQHLTTKRREVRLKCVRDRMRSPQTMET